MTFAKNSGKGAGMKRFCSPPLFAVISLSALAGCADTTQAPPMFCPQVAVLQQAQTLTAFLPGRSDVASQVTTAQITGVAGSCKLEEDKNQLLVNFQAGFTASNGPANNGNTLTLPFFVALANGDNIVSKTDYTIALPFNGNASMTQVTSKPVKVELSNDHASKNIQILVGFELTPDQLSYAEAHPAGP
jgi:hypothetical protein